MHKDFHIVRAHQDEMPIIMDWAKQAGWNPGINDASCFYQADPNGFFLGKIKDAIIAMGAAVIYEKHYAFCGLYMVEPNFRHQGYGMALTKARLAYVGDRTVGLDGVLPMVDKYKNLGYKIAHHNYRFRFKAALCEEKYLANIVDANTVPFEDLVLYDANYFGAHRPHFLRAWINQTGGVAAVFMDDGHIVGLGVLRPCYKGYKIGPLFAQNIDVARGLLHYLLCRVEGEEVFLDVPECNPHAMALVHEFVMVQEFETVRMYRNPKPLINMHCVYGITTFELG